MIAQWGAQWWAALPHDALFYAVAVPSALLLGLGKSGFGAGFGSLATPLLALAMPVPQAAAVMLPLLTVADLVGLSSLMREADRRLLWRLLPAALVGVLIGWLSFGLLGRATVSGIVGGLTLLFLAQQVFFPPRADARAAGPWAGAVLGMTSGYTSFVAHAGGPPVIAYLLPMRLPPMTYTATLAVLFGAVNLSKWPMYASLGLIDLRGLATSIGLMPLAMLGVWIGLKLARRLSPRRFYLLAQLGMLLTGLKLLADAWPRG
ncbi:hypothetical protein C7444_106131 [Sphaerotilus hippei]|uniref:Probable membrane transporter protein n=1 Tax=Sphaerotilus hippei TaxID=744406 RepID=A0A318H1B1_9BURK|nr:sulfite exporter TauE/SafE family protein [Sphaerotilus hippei]PXW96612.1 hypothetical protein C7444_106131 [Sphaerotilus hippei]